MEPNADLLARASPIELHIRQEEAFAERCPLETNGGELAGPAMGAIAADKPPGVGGMVSPTAAQGELDLAGFLLGGDKFRLPQDLAMEVRQTGPQARFDLGLADEK